MKLNPLERLIRKIDNEESDEIKEELYRHIIEWLEEKTCPACMDWPDEHAKHCPICDGTGIVYIDYNHKKRTG